MWYTYEYKQKHPLKLNGQENSNYSLSIHTIIYKSATNKCNVMGAEFYTSVVDHKK